MPNRRTMMRTSLAAFALTPIGAAGLRADEASVADTAAGKIRGASVGRPACLQGHSLWRLDSRRQPLHAAAQARTLDGRARGDRLCRPLAAGAARGAQRPELATVWGLLDRLPVGEDCLTLHVWTPALDTAKRRSWSGCTAAPSPTARPTRRATTAATSPGATTSWSSRVNHRLNIFGHLDLSASGGERFAQSGNAGVLDLVAALQWVREHAARFGGDPGNVTIFGQSGGGGKVSALLAMPGAKGLFHKAIIESGAGVRFAERERTTRLAECGAEAARTRSAATGSPAGAADRAA